jgi:hypothetical protein
LAAGTLLHLFTPSNYRGNSKRPCTFDAKDIISTQLKYHSLLLPTRVLEVVVYHVLNTD